MKNKKTLYIPLFFVVVIITLLYFSRFTVTDNTNISLSVYDGNANGWNITKFEDDKEVPMNAEDIYGYSDTVVLRREVEPYFADFHRINISSITAACVFIEDELVFSTIDEPIEEIGKLPLLQGDPELPFDLTFTIEPSWIGKTMTVVTREFEESPVGGIGIELVNDHFYNLQHEAVVNSLSLPAGAYGLLSVLLFGLFLWGSFTYKTDFSILLLTLASACLVFMQTSRLEERIFYDSLYGVFVSLLYLFTILYISLKLRNTKKWFSGVSIVAWAIYFIVYICVYYLYIPLPYWVDKISVLIIVPLILLIVACFLERAYNSFARLLLKLLISFGILGTFLYVAAYFTGSEIYMHIKVLFLEATNLYFQPMLIWIFTILIFSFFILAIWEILQHKIEETNTIAELNLVNSLHEQSLMHAERTNSELAIMRHDEIHHLRTLTTYLNVDTQKAKEYLHSLSDDLEKISTVRFSTNKLINSILSAVSYNAKEQNIDFTALANVKETLSLRDTDVSAVIMNLCDNAIKAAQNSEQKSMDIVVSQDSDMLYIKISNSIPKNFDKKIFYDALNSQEINHHSLHGHGLVSVKNILNSYGGELHYEIEHDYIILRTVMQF